MDDLPLSGGLLGFMMVGAKPYKPTRRERIKQFLRDAMFYSTVFAVAAFALLVVALGLWDVGSFAFKLAKGWL